MQESLLRYYCYKKETQGPIFSLPLHIWQIVLSFLCPSDRVRASWLNRRIRHFVQHMPLDEGKLNWHGLQSDWSRARVIFSFGMGIINTYHRSLLGSKHDANFLREHAWTFSVFEKNIATKRFVTCIFPMCEEPVADEHVCVCFCRDSGRQQFCSGHKIIGLRCDTCVKKHMMRGLRLVKFA